MNRKEKLRVVNVIQNAKQILNIVENVNSVIIKDGNDNIELIVKRDEKCLNK